jgi:hypothetical protein
MKYAIVIALALSSCAPGLVAGNEAGGVVRIRGMLDGQAKGMTYAETECHKYGRIARYDGVNEIRGTLRYECVNP